MYFNILFYACFSRFVCFLFCVFCVFVFCVFLLLCITVSSIFVQVCRPLPPGRNPVAGNKYHISDLISRVVLFNWRVKQKEV